MRKFSNKQVFRAALMVGGASILAVANPAMAQNAAGQDDEEAVEGEAPQDSIIVTGSRIRRQDYDANSPIVTVDGEFFQQSSTAAVEQQLNKLPQFVVSQSSTVKNNEGTLTAAGGDIQPNATNTPGAATISLRGVGANRTLVLIDGRRGTPANASGAVDVSTIPSAALGRVEIISGGASATYGADAVAGVTNFILRSDFEGVELDGSMGISQEGVGFEYQLSGIMGADLADGRGNVSLAMSVNTREKVLQSELPFYQDLWNNPDTSSGSFFFVPRPGISGIGLQANSDGTTPGCEALPQGCVLSNMFPGASPTVPNNTGSVWLNQDGSLFLGTAGFGGASNAQRGGAAFFQPWPTRDAETGAEFKYKSNDRLYAYNALTPATVPTTRYNFLARGNYEINDWIGVFGQGLFSNSTTYTVQEASGAQFGWDVILPWGSGTYTGDVNTFFGSYDNPAVPSSVLADGVTTNPAFTQQYGAIFACANNPTGGCTNTEVFEQVVPQNIQDLLNARPNPNAAFSLAGFLPNPRATDSEVTTFTLIAGLEGSVPGTDWTWEAFVNHGQSYTVSRQTGMYSLSRLRAVFTAPNMGQNFSYTSNQFGGLGGLSPGFGAAAGSCTSGMNFFGGYQGISDDCREAIASDVTNTNKSRQTIGEFNLQGGLFDLPAGQLRFATGVSYRENELSFNYDGNTTAGRSFLDSIVGIYPGTNMEGIGLNSHEAYAELLIPVLSDLPMIQEFNLEVGGRISDYSTTGTSYTFKILGDWQVTDWLRFRGGFNRAERAPNIAELLLAPQQSFGTDPIGDVCSTRHGNSKSANPTTNATNALDVQALCLEMMARDNGGVYVPITDPNSYYFAADADTRQAEGGGGFTFAYSVGNQYYRENINSNIPELTPEVADTWTIGTVIRSPATSGPLSRLSFTADYFNIKISDPIGKIDGGAVLLSCLNPDKNAAVDGIAAGASSPADLNTPEIRARAQAALQQSTCATVFRQATAGSGTNGGLDSARILGSYGNEGLVKLSGIDASLNWSTDAGPGTVNVGITGSYLFNFDVQALDGEPLLDYVGTTGTGALGLNFGSSFEYRLFSTIGYSIGGANISLQWQHTPATQDSNEVQFLNGIPGSTPSDDSGLPAYNMFNLNGSYALTDNVGLRFGVDNLFNKRPPLSNINPNFDAASGQLPGGGYSFFHDAQGRRFSLGANLRF